MTFLFEQGVMKRCKSCGVEKPLSEFYRARKHPLADCKVCWRERIRARRLVNPAVRAYDRARAKTPERVEKAKAVTKRWRERNPAAYQAQTAVNNAIRDGKINKQPCQLCGANDIVHGHHKDYAKPLEVTWLCPRCHHRMHALFPEMEGVNKGIA